MVKSPFFSRSRFNRSLPQNRRSWLGSTFASVAAFLGLKLPDVKTGELGEQETKEVKERFFCNLAKDSGPFYGGTSIDFPIEAVDVRFNQDLGFNQQLAGKDAVPLTTPITVYTTILPKWFKSYLNENVHGTVKMGCMVHVSLDSKYRVVEVGIGAPKLGQLMTYVKLRRDLSILQCKEVLESCIDNPSY
jgi:hypothetical protein